MSEYTNEIKYPFTLTTCGTKFELFLFEPFLF